jgi:hypothetical protein
VAFVPRTSDIRRSFRGAHARARHGLTEHTRYHVRAVEWQEQERSSALVLRGKTLKQAESWLARGTSKDPKPSLLQSQFIAAGRQAADRFQRLVAAALSAGLLVAIALAVFAFLQRNEAQSARDEALHRLYTSQLARVATTIDSDPGKALDTLYETLQSAAPLREFTWDLHRRLADRTVFALGGAWNGGLRSDAYHPAIAISPDGRRIATAAVRRTKQWGHSGYGDRAHATEVLVADIGSGAQVARLLLLESTDEVAVEDLAFTPDGKRLVACAGGHDGVLKMWNVDTGEELVSRNVSYIRRLAFAPPGSQTSGPSERLITLTMSGELLLWDVLNSTAAPRKLASTYVAAFSFGSSSDELINRCVGESAARPRRRH